MTRFFRLCVVPWPLALYLGLLLGLGPSASAATVVKFGAVRQISKATDLDLQGEFVYAVNFSTDDPPRTVRGVTFQPDRLSIPGATFVTPQFVTPWQNKPEFGSTADDNQLEEILHDIRWADAGSGQILRANLAVTAGETYKLQLLISGNGNENRRWDIRVGGREAVDEITSLGSSPGHSYAQNRATLYSCEWSATSSTLVVEMGTFFGGNDGGDRNPIWQALTLEKISIPPSPDDLILETRDFFAGQTAPISTLRAADRKFGALHTFALVSGFGDADNHRFQVAETNLLAGEYDFSVHPPGTPFQIRLRATDSADPLRFMEKTFVLTLAAKEAPSDLELDAGSVNAYARGGMLVAKARVTDANTFDKHTFQLVEGSGSDHNSYLQLTGNELRLSRDLPAELTELKFRVKATDLSGLTLQKEFVLPLIMPEVILSEVLSGNEGGLEDESLEPQDWVELYNKLPQWVDLSGFYLSDSKDERTKWRFPNSSVIAPGGHLVVLADGRTDQPVPSSYLHANFRLNSGGEWIGFTRPDGTGLLSELDVTAFLPGVSFGISADGRAGYFQTPTPGGPNGSIADFGTNAVQFSMPRGHYQKAFTLELSSSIAGSVIRYTLDGTRPSATRGTIYTGPIQVSPNSVGITRGVRIVRAVAVNSQAAYAPVATQTYLFVNGSTGPAVDGVVSQSVLASSITRHGAYAPLIADAFTTLPVISMILPGGPSTLQQPASLEFIEPGAEGFQIDCGVNATGTTSMASPKLSMSAKFSLRYGASSLKYPVFANGSRFPDGAATEFKELRLRSHSHDTFYWLGTAENPPVPYGNPPVMRSGDAQYVRNLWIEEMQMMMGQPGKHGRQAHLFLNGAYHGIYHIQEHVDEDFMASYLPGSSDDYHWTNATKGGSDHGPGDSWSDAWTKMKSSLGNLTQAKRWVDLANLCDYMILNFYAGNDWDWLHRHNWSAAGPRAPDRGGWKFFAQDSDISLQDVNADATDQDAPDGVFSALMQHSDFKVLFRDRVYKHLFNDGPLTPQRAGAFYDHWMNEINLAIIAETARWQPGSTVGTPPWDRNQEWTNEWRYLKNTFFPQRTGKLLAQFRQRGWWPADPPKGNATNGQVPAGFSFTFAPGIGSIRYTLDGSDPRLPGGAVNPAAKSVGSGSTETTLLPAGASWRFLDKGAAPQDNWKEQDFDDSLWKSGPAEIGYGDGGEATLAEFIDTDAATPGIQKNATTYFRKVFDAPGVAAYSSILLRLVRDDGAVVYLNGKEVWRSNMPEGPISPGTLAVAGVGGADESTFFELSLPAAEAGLKPTGNVLAVEVHQQLIDSSDISFNFELKALAPGTTSSIVVSAPTLIRARAFSNGDWSALSEIYLVPEGIAAASAMNLVISEIQYHPLSQSTNEFLEFVNTSPGLIDLSGVVLSNAVSFQFPRGTLLGPDERIVVVKEPDAFRAMYQEPASPYFKDGIRTLGPWVGSLSNSGEAIDVIGADGEVLFSCRYDSSGAWPGRADGKGSSLELPDPYALPLDRAGKTAWLSSPANWVSSSEFNGSPARAGAGADHRLVFNEILAASVSPQLDAIELKNVSANEVELGGWFLSDSSDNYRKYRFPNGTKLAPNERLALNETDFNDPANTNNLQPFALNSAGDDLYLVEASSNGALLRFVQRAEFGPTPAGRALGRWPDGTGPLVWMQMPTFGQLNSPPVPGFTAWAATAFNPGTNPSLMTTTADPDGDGLNNFSEYAFVSSPLKKNGPQISLGGWQGAEKFVFSYPARTGATDLEYQVEFSTDLASWQTHDESLEVLGSQERPDGSTVWIHSVHAPAMLENHFLFIRVKAAQKP